MPHIPIYFINKRTDFGIQVKRVSDPHVWDGINALGIHRNDDYMFVLVEQAERQGSMELDFNQVSFKERSLCCIVPGQVHYNVNAKKLVVWLVSVSPTLISKDYLQFFDTNFIHQQIFTLTESQFTQSLDILRLLEKQSNSNSSAVFYRQLTHSILNTFLCLVVSVYMSANSLYVNNISRPVQITRDFKKLLRQNIRDEKNPSYYSGKLNISETYLNEAIKKTTGFTATYLIHEEVMLEAKRLLCFSKLTVKEIAYSLGYEDHTYFSKLFKKHTKNAPLAFRNNYLK